MLISVLGAFLVVVAGLAGPSSAELPPVTSCPHLSVSHEHSAAAEVRASEDGHCAIGAFLSDLDAYDDTTTRVSDDAGVLPGSILERVATKAGGGGAGAADDVFEPLSGINPSGSKTNCVRCVGAARDTLNGTPRVAGPGPAVVPDEVLGPRSLWGPSVDDVAGQLTSPGSHGIVQVPSATQPSHMLTVINEGGTIRYVDPQAGGAIVPTPSEIWGYWPG